MATMVQAVSFKMQPNNHHVLRHKTLNHEKVHPHVPDSRNSPLNTRIKVTLVARPLLNRCADANMVYLEAGCVLLGIEIVCYCS
jgi:hypothetical protein